jgi:hypothetical protein
MNNTHYKNLRNSSSKWLFAVALLLSFFTFSGYTTQTPNRFTEQQSTSISVINRQTLFAKSISYKRALTFVHSKWFASAVFGPAFDISYAYNRWVKTRISELKEPFLPGKLSFFSLQKTIPQDSDDEPAILG